jgi:hypothetical protein
VPARWCFCWCAAVAMVRLLPLGLLAFLMAQRALVTAEEDDGALIRLVRAEFRAEMDARALKHQAVIAQQQAVIEELQAQYRQVYRQAADLIVSTTMQRQRDAADPTGRAFAAGGTVTGGGGGGRGLSSSDDECAQPSGPNLLVHGVCSCTEDVIIGETSVRDALDNLTAAVDALQVAVHGNTTTHTDS